MTSHLNSFSILALESLSQLASVGSETSPLESSVVIHTVSDISGQTTFHGKAVLAGTPSMEDAQSVAPQALLAPAVEETASALSDAVTAALSGDAGLSAQVAALVNVTTSAVNNKLQSLVDQVSAVTEGAVGSTGIKGETGAAGAEGPAGATGPQGDIGPTGNTGASGFRGATGPQGLVGPAGVAGPRGATGPTGPQGITGPTGPTGPVGAAGKRGDIGVQGESGDAGATGPQGDVLFEVREHLIPYQTDVLDIGEADAGAVLGRRVRNVYAHTLFLDANTLNLGSVALSSTDGAFDLPASSEVGGLSAAGAALRIAAFASELPQSNVAPGTTSVLSADGSYAVGDVVVVGRNLHQLLSIGADAAQTLLWRNMGALKGAKGEAGVAGEAGEVGPQGAQGERGATGPEGAVGKPGPEGAAGPAGTQQGVRGPKGLTGERGATGPIGVIGVLGERGVKGLKGATGPTGPRGSVGDVGAQGATGPVGDMGGKGPVGVQGVKGPVGDKGVDGPSGPSGPQGPRGPVGATGPQGMQGLPGDAGDEGDMGEVGIKGPEGVQGDQGFQGATGPKGAGGDKGATGPTGPQGATGPAGAAAVGLSTEVVQSVDRANVILTAVYTGASKTFNVSQTGPLDPVFNWLAADSAPLAGWRFQNAVAGSKINLYFMDTMPSEYHASAVSAQLVRATALGSPLKYANFKSLAVRVQVNKVWANVLSDLFLALYSAPTGSLSGVADKSSWYRSRKVAVFQPTDTSALQIQQDQLVMSKLQKEIQYASETDLAVKDQLALEILQINMQISDLDDQIKAAATPTVNDGDVLVFVFNTDANASLDSFKEEPTDKVINTAGLPNGAGAGDSKYAGDAADFNATTDVLYRLSFHTSSSAAQDSVDITALSAKYTFGASTFSVNLV